MITQAILALLEFEVYQKDRALPALRLYQYEIIDAMSLLQIEL